MNTSSLSHNAPISEFIEMLREWLIAGNADPRAINKVDEIRENLQDGSELGTLLVEREEIAQERDDIADELKALYDVLMDDEPDKNAHSAAVTAQLKWARLCIERHKIT